MSAEDDPSASAAPASSDQPESQQQDAPAAPWEPTAEQQQLIDAAEALKAEGNALYARGEHEQAIAKYAAAIEGAPEGAPQRAVYHANIAACHVKLERHKEAIRACSEALQIDPGYVKALSRRSASHEASGELDRALADAKRVRGSAPPPEAARTTAPLAGAAGWPRAGRN
jgi:tetratricopeptide (TPR) repeat protein